MSVFQQFLRDETAATAIEYATIASMLAICCLLGAKAIGVNLSARFLGPLLSGFP